MTSIQLDPMAYWTYNQAMTAVLANFLRTAWGGQFVLKSTDIESPEVQRIASSTISDLQATQGVLTDVIASIRKNVPSQIGSGG